MQAIYGRQSVDKGEQSLSIESQIEECKKRIPGNEPYVVYQDKGYTGANTNRPDFIRLMNDVKAGKISKVIIWKLDRISRSLLDFANILSIYNEYNVSFDSVTENFDTSTPMGRAMLSIVMVFAQLERETIQLRIIANYQKRAEKGFYLGGPPTFGLKKVPITVNGYKTSTYELDPEHGSTLLKIFDMYAEGDKSLRKIAKYLNENEYKAHNDTKWESQKLSRILHNPTYVKSDADVYQYYKTRGVNILFPVEEFNGNGLYLYGRRKGNERKYTNVKDHNLAVALHEGYIDSKIWLKIQYKLESNIQLKNAGKGKHTWLSGIAKCGLCGYAMSGQNMGKYSAFRCSRRINVGDCNSVSNVRIHEVEVLVWDSILKKIEELKNVSLEENKNDSRINTFKIKLVQIEEQMENLVNAVAQGNQAIVKILNERISKLDSERNAIAAEIQKITVQASNVETDDILNIVKEDLGFEEKRLIAKALIEKVFIYIKGHEPIIQWRF